MGVKRKIGKGFGHESQHRQESAAAVVGGSAELIVLADESASSQARDSALGSADAECALDRDGVLAARESVVDQATVRSRLVIASADESASSQACDSAPMRSADDDSSLDRGNPTASASAVGLQSAHESELGAGIVSAIAVPVSVTMGSRPVRVRYVPAHLRNN